jgi:hypothetical protein
MFVWLIALLCALPLAYWATPLAFDPVPWPDDSAFFLTGLDWIRWPSHYLMRSQAPFAPSYDLANFNTMPGMPLFLGVGAHLGLNGSQSIRLYGMAALAAWSVALALWLRKRGASPAWTWAISLAAALSPAIRWGAMVVRPEIWQGLFWLLILMELDGFFEPIGPDGQIIPELRTWFDRWRIPTLLALAAYFHFEAFLWIIPTALGVALLPPARPKPAIMRLIGVGWRTAALLSPWVVYVLAHWTVFWIQMDTQFNRLEAHHPYLGSAYNWFHHLWLSLGNPAGYPKFFNLGKALTWGLLVGGVIKVAVTVFRQARARAVGLAAIAGLIATFYLWATKPETWFTAMIHLALWPVVILGMDFGMDFKKARSPLNKLSAGVLLAVLVGLATLEAGVAIDQERRLARDYSWPVYRDWVDCIDRTIGDRTRVWQPHWPDVLVQLAGRRPERDYTRAVDFPDIDPLIAEHARRTQAIVHSLYLEGLDAAPARDHTGELRERDRFYLTDYPWIPFKQYTGLKLGRDIQVCQRGPFWAAITLLPLEAAK